MSTDPREFEHPIDDSDNTPNRKAIEVAARAEAPHLWNGKFEATLLRLNRIPFTPEQAAEAAEQKRQEHLARAETYLTAAAPIMRAEVLRDFKALTQVAVDMAAASTSPAHHVIAAIFSVSKLEDQAKAEALREAADAVEAIDPAWDSALYVDGAYHPVPDWLRARAATIEGKSE